MSESATHDNNGVVGCAQTFEPDELPGFERATLELPEQEDGALAATLVRAVRQEPDPRPAVLYVHGFVDYFFHDHLAAAFEEAGFRFYAIDLRRYGRSIRDGNRACMAWDVEEYFTELDWAVAMIKERHPDLAALIAHSTGGLIGSLYLSSRKGRHIAGRFVAVSPFLRFNYYGFVLAQIRVVAKLARLAPTLPLPQRLNEVYGMVLHQSHGGEWDYDLKKKPIRGFPLYAGWFRMIRKAQARVEKGLGLTLPILSMHSDRSRRPGNAPTEEDRSADTVLNVEHIRELSLKLGDDVSLCEIPEGLHDLTLSRKPVRNSAIAKMVSFVKAGVNAST